MSKVLQINSVVNSGSTGRIAEQISNKALQSGWESSIAYGRYAGSSSASLIKIGSQTDIYIHALKSLLFGKHGLASQNATKSFIEKVKFLQPDIIHLHNIHGYYLNYKLLFEFLKDYSGNIIWTLHDCWAFTGHCTYFSDINCNKWVTECHNCPKIRNYPKSLFFDTSREGYNLKKNLFTGIENMHIVTVSDWLNGLVRNSFLKDYPITTIHNAVDLSVFKPKDLNQSLVYQYKLSGKFVMLTASTSWAKQKGFDDYMELSSRLKEDEVLVMIGLKDDVIKKLPTNIIGINRTESQQELADWYNIADVVLNLSYQETFGMTTVEGFACGKPTIVYNATASPELVPNDRLGYIISPGAIEQVHQVIQKIKENGAEYYVDSCQNAAIEKYNMEVQFQKYINLYENMLNQ